MCRLTRHILSPQTICTTAAHFVARRQIVHGGDTMCRQRRHNLSPATNCAGATKCAVTERATELVHAVYSSTFRLVFSYAMWRYLFHPNHPSVYFKSMPDLILIQLCHVGVVAFTTGTARIHQLECNSLGCVEACRVRLVPMSATGVYSYPCHLCTSCIPPYLIMGLVSLVMFLPCLICVSLCAFCQYTIQSTYPLSGYLHAERVSNHGNGDL